MPAVTLHLPERSSYSARDVDLVIEPDRFLDGVVLSLRGLGGRRRLFVSPQTALDVALALTGAVLRLRGDDPDLEGPWDGRS